MTEKNEFRTHPTLYVYGILAFIIFMLSVPFWGWLLVMSLISNASAVIILIFAIFILSCLYILYRLFRLRKLFFAKSCIDETGITEKYLAADNRFLAWDAVIDCGIIKASQSSVDQIFCIYFSESKLTMQQKSGKSAYSEDGKLQNAIRIPLCPDAVKILKQLAPENVFVMLKNDPLFPSEWISDDE